jgi:poly-gamma-glutamate capsule biosynthesis protein CapA/YwtB (metallophosphatase superfamily)
MAFLYRPLAAVLMTSVCLAGLGGMGSGRVAAASSLPEAHASDPDGAAGPQSTRSSSQVSPTAPLPRGLIETALQRGKVAKLAARRPAAEQSVTLAFAGDVHFQGPLSDGRLGGQGRSLAAADLAMVNMETAVTDRGSPSSQEFVFRGPGSALRNLRASGVDVVTIANNHGMDYGTTGLLDTLEAAKTAGLPLVGGGTNSAAAFAPYRTTIHGDRIAVFGATQVLDDSLRSAWTAGPNKPGLASAYDVSTLLAAVRAARQTSDTVVVYLHWGVENQSCPPARAQTLAHQLVSAGANVIVGSHAHVLLGDGRLGGAYVDYGLGNFQFYNGSGVNAQTGVLTLTVRGRATISARFEPGLMQAGRPAPLTGSARAAALAAREQLRPCTGLQAP